MVNYFKVIKSKFEFLLEYMEENSEKFIVVMDKFFRRAFLVFGIILGIRLLFSGIAFIVLMGLCMMSVVFFLGSSDED